MGLAAPRPLGSFTGMLPTSVSTAASLQKELNMAEDRVQALRSRIWQLESDPSNGGCRHSHGEHLRITIARPLEGGKLGVLVQDRVVASISDPRALDHGWCVGDMILQVNGQRVDSMFEFSGVLALAMASHQANGSPLTFEVCRHPGSGIVAAAAVPATATATPPTTILAAPSCPQVVRSARPPVQTRPLHRLLGCCDRSESPQPHRSLVYSQVSEASTSSSTVRTDSMTARPPVQAQVLRSNSSLSTPGSSLQPVLQPVTQTLAAPLHPPGQPLLVPLPASQQALVPQTNAFLVQQQQKQQQQQQQHHHHHHHHQQPQQLNAQQSQQGLAQQLRKPGGCGSAVLPATNGELPLPKVRPKAAARRRVC